MTAVHSAAATALARVDPASLPTTSRSGLPAWADSAVLAGEPNAYFDAKDQARTLTAAQRQGLPSLIQSIEEKLQGPNADARGHLADALVQIAVRVQPGITESAGFSWATGMVDSLSRTPTDLLAKAIEAARYRQFQFLNEVGPFLASEIDEPLRWRNIKLNRLREIQLAASALPAPGQEGYCPPDVASQLTAELVSRQAARRSSVAAETGGPIDWDAETAKRNADANFVRVAHGLPPRTVEQYVADQKASLRQSAGMDAPAAADDLGDNWPN